MLVVLKVAMQLNPNPLLLEGVLAATTPIIKRKGPADPAKFPKGRGYAGIM